MGEPAWLPSADKEQDSLGYLAASYYHRAELYFTRKCNFFTIFLKAKNGKNEGLLKHLQIAKKTETGFFPLFCNTLIHSWISEGNP